MRFVVAWVVLLVAISAAAKPPPDGVYADLPFMEWKQEFGVGRAHIVVDMAAEGQRAFPLVLDTGAGFSTMTVGYAKQLGVTVRRTKDSPYRRKTSLGRDVQFSIDTSLSDSASKAGWNVGLLGGNFMEKYNVEINYAARRVRFLDPKTHGVPREPTTEGEIIVPIEIYMGRPHLELEVGTGKASFLIDTGAPFDLEVSEQTAKRLGIAYGDGAIVEGQNWVGRDRSVVTKVDSVRLGDHELGSSEVEVTLREGSDWRHTNLAGRDEALLGAGFLNRYLVRIDYKNKRMSLVPFSDEERQRVLASLMWPGANEKKHADTPAVGLAARWQGPTTLRLGSAGLELTEKSPGQFTVDSVEQAGLAASVGLREADVITHAYGEEPLTPEAIEAKVIAGHELSVTRKIRGNWVDMVVPELSFTDEE